MSDYRAQLQAVEAKLAKEPDNEDLLTLKADLLEILELADDIEEEPSPAITNEPKSSTESDPKNSSRTGSDDGPRGGASSKTSGDINSTINKKEAEILARKKEKNRKKKEKLREKIKSQLDIAEGEKQSWQSFANRKGLKGVTKKSIFASPCSVTGKVGVGTNGIADAPSAVIGTMQRNYAVRRKG